MALQAAGVAALAVLEAAGVLKSGVDLYQQGGPQYIRDGNPVGVTATLGLALARSACRRYAADPTALPSDTAANYEKSCRPYLDDIGAGAGAGLKVPFIGGQCVGVSYGYNRTITTVSAFCSDPGTPFTSTGTSEGSGSYVGPILGTRTRLIGSGDCGPTTAQLLITDSGGPGGTARERVAESFVNPSFIRYNSISASGVSFFRLSGSGDCGNPPPDVVQPTPDPNPLPPQFPITIAPNIDVDVNLTFNNIGQVVIDLGLGPVTIDPFADGGDGGGGGLAPTVPGDIGGPATAIPTGVGGEAEGTAPPGTVLTGLELTLETIPPYAREYAPGVFRGVCYAYMGVPGKLDQDFAGALLRDGQFIFAELDFLTAWRVVANVGYNIRVTPYYREIST